MRHAWGAGPCAMDARVGAEMSRFLVFHRISRRYPLLARAGGRCYDWSACSVSPDAASFAGSSMT